MKKNLSYLFVAALAMCALTFTSCDGGDDPAPAQEYTITVNAATGGSASAGVTKAAAGASITVTALAAENFRHASWTVEPGSITLSGNPATFTMPAGNVTITPVFEDSSAPKPTTANISGKIAKGETRELDAEITYTITGPVIVEDGGTLTIPAGTLVKGEGFSSYILVLQGGKINVNGTAEKPVKMTSTSTSPKSGEWGGLVINGRAPITGYVEGTVGTYGKTEISNAYPYGGTNPADNSGQITYLILEGTGAKTSSDVEHNGLTLNGVGSGTKIENVFVVNGADDGIEFFGGSVNVTGLLVVNSDDDMFDFTQGYSGELKNAYGIWQKGFSTDEADPRGVEGDGNLDGLTPGATPQSDCKLTNITIDLRLDYVDPAAADAATKTMQDVFKIRRGAKAAIANALVKGTGRVSDLVDFGDGAGNGNFASSVVLVNNLANAARATAPIADHPEAYDNVTVTEGEEGGCDSSIFGWVATAGYDIF
jgi:hypothetical protein